MDGLKLEYVSAEELCYDADYGICGKYDLIIIWNGKRTLIELKTGTFPMWGGLQLAAYERMVDVDDVMGISLSNGGKVFVKADDFLENTITWDDINCGTFDLDKWKSNRNRRCMKVFKNKSTLMACRLCKKLVEHLIYLDGAVIGLCEKCAKSVKERNDT
jgi:hypothetical protein